MSQKGDRPRFAKNRASVAIGNRVSSTIDAEFQRNVNYNFLSGIVREVISDPYTYLNQGEQGSGLSLDRSIIKNYPLLDNMPMNSIIVQLVDDNRGSDGDKAIVAYPFFPSHFSLPLKPGEYVWLIEEDLKGVKYYHWMCRKAGVIQTEDLNYTSHERSVDIVDTYTSIKNQGNAITISVEDAVALHTFDKIPSSNLPRNLNYADIFLNSKAFLEEHTGEPVPRVLKKCDDLLIQGSNNAGIHITTEKFEISDDERSKPTGMTDKTDEKDVVSFRQPSSPAIDIFVHRKYTDLIEDASNKLGGDEIKTDRLNLIRNKCDNPKYEHYEINKTADITSGDFLASNKEITDDENEIMNVSNRLYMSSNCNIDKIFENSFDLETKKGASAALFSYENTRVIGKKSTRVSNLSGQSFIDLDEEGNINIKGSGKVYLKSVTPSFDESEPYVIHSKLKDTIDGLILIIENLPGSIAGDPAAATSVVEGLIEAKINVELLASSKIFGE